jgi:hypothetical protein
MNRVYAVCTYCGRSFRTYHPEPGWVCESCEPDATADAVSAITSGLRRDVGTYGKTCQYDGCLLIGPGTCPACHLRLSGPGSATTPFGWIRKGLIYVKESIA